MALLKPRMNADMRKEPGYSFAAEHTHWEFRPNSVCEEQSPQSSGTDRSLPANVDLHSVATVQSPLFVRSA